MGYWIIVVLIVLGGVLVLVAAASVDRGDELQTKPGPRKPARDQSAVPLRLPNQPRVAVSLAALIPGTWLQGKQTRLAWDVPGTVTDTKLLGGSMLSDVAVAIDALGDELEDSIVAFIVGADEFLAGHSLDDVLDHLDRLLDRLTELPALAVVGSIPNLAPELAAKTSGVSEASISATIAVWNRAIGGLVRSYTAEFVDLESVPVHLLELDCTAHGPPVSAIPHGGALTTAIEPAIGRAADRVRSLRSVS